MTTKPRAFCACDYGVPCQPAADALRAERDALRVAAADALAFLTRPHVRRLLRADFVADVDALNLAARLQALTANADAT